ncbi:MAG: type II secretion system F family protein [Bacteriovoracaceae bacterium]|nr:type II secretion system F family protein [Bacteriovoracaceae bacterium]
MRLIFFIFQILVFFFWAPLIYGQEEASCGSDYNLIDFTCVKNFDSKMKKKNLLVTELKIGDVYFFKTKNDHLGKFEVKHASDDKGECGVYLSSEAFVNGKIMSKESEVFINNSLGVWSSNKIDLDSLSPFDINLRRSEGITQKNSKCFIDGMETKFVFYKNIADSPLKRGSTLIFLAMLLLFGVSAFLMAMTIFKDEGAFAVQEKFEDADSNKIVNYAKYGIVLKYSRVFFRRYFTPIVQGMKNKNSIKEKYRRPIANGGLLNIITPEDFFAFKLFLILGFPALFLVFRFLMEMDWSLALTPVVSFVGFIYPDIWLKSRTERRKKDIITAMPFIVDMLALSIEAGLDFIAAIARVMEKAPPSALSEEFEIMIKEIKIGSSRADALRQMSWRVDEIVVNSFCATLIAADSVGASVGPILKTLSNEIRQKRSSLIEQAGAKAATKILFPMIIFILPAVFIITFAPLALDIIGK